MKKDKAGGPGLGGLLVKTKARLKSFGGRFGGTTKSSKNLKFGTRYVVEVWRILCVAVCEGRCT